jgi:hypothetical protein
MTCKWRALQVKYRNLLTMILSHAYGDTLPEGFASALELDIVQALRWRLGPFFHSLPSCCAASPAPAASTDELDAALFHGQGWE